MNYIRSPDKVKRLLHISVSDRSKSKRLGR
jgi:hypothetical protein